MKKTDLTEHKLDSKAVFEGRLLHVRSDTVRLPDGKTATREYILHPGAVVVIPVLDNGDLILERQHRYPLHRDFIELPAGKIDPGEEPLSCARRELLEESGYTAREWGYVTTVYPCIGYAETNGWCITLRAGWPTAAMRRMKTNSWKFFSSLSRRRWKWCAVARFAK